MIEIHRYARGKTALASLSLILFGFVQFVALDSAHPLLFASIYLPGSVLLYIGLRRPGLYLDANDIVVRGIVTTRRMPAAQFSALKPDPGSLGRPRLESVDGESLPFLYGPSTYSNARRELASRLKDLSAVVSDESNRIDRDSNGPGR